MDEKCTRMDEKKIMQYFTEYGFNPYRIKLFKNKITKCLSNFFLFIFILLEKQTML